MNGRTMMAWRKATGIAASAVLAATLSAGLGACSCSSQQTSETEITTETDGVVEDEVIEEEVDETTGEPEVISKTARLAGEDRYQTMSLIVGEAFTSSEWAVVASGANFPDALAASSVAGARSCPIILTEAESLTTEASEQLVSLGVTSAYIVGGEAAVSADVEQAISDLGIECTRLAGSDRATTSAELFAETRNVDSASNTVVVATGYDFPDALSIGPWSYATKSPIALANSDGSLADSLVSAITEDTGITRVILLGADDVVSDAIQEQLGDTYEYQRISGADTYENNGLIAEFEASEGLGWTKPAVATGENFPDALAAVALAGRNQSVLLLTDAADGPAIEALGSNKGSVESVYLIGGEGAVSPEVEEAINAALA